MRFEEKDWKTIEHTVLVSTSGSGTGRKLLMQLVKVLFFKVLEDQPPLPAEKAPQKQLPPEPVPEPVPESVPVPEPVPEPAPPEPSSFNPFAAIDTPAETEPPTQPSKKSKK
jgi:hypothetical protein